MRVLRPVAPTPEQLKVINDHKPGSAVIRGAAGSGKTTTALLRFHFLVERRRARRERMKMSEPVRALVLTYNRTLRGYIAELANHSITIGSDLDVEIATFAGWSKRATGARNIVRDDRRVAEITRLGAALPLDPEFLADEVDYVLGRYLPATLRDYLTARREGRGSTPRVDQTLRARLLDEVIQPYAQWKVANNLVDWNDLALQMATGKHGGLFDVVVVDEAQDFSANQVRAIMNHLAADHSVTFILDAVQRIYPRFFTWREVGVTVPAGNMFRLAANHRNTKQIAAFATQLIAKLELTDDGTLPDLKRCTRDGPLPKIVLGKYSAQLGYAIDYIKRFIDLPNESVAFLHPKGYGWFDYTRDRLREAKLPFAEITRELEWPIGDESIALSTLHSAKGLEFDHVFILGLNAEVAPHGAVEEDGRSENLQRLVAMAVGRARTTVALGYNPNDAPPMAGLLKRDTYERVELK